jgi:predicted glutamine amidotransferase
MIALMCRLFAFRSVLPLCGFDALCGAGNSLTAQSRCDARGESHADGWGLATVDHDGEPHISKSVQPAFADPQFAELAKSVATTLVVHVRQASVGRKALENSHPFVHGRWIFAHNGTLEEFAARKRPLLDAIPDDLRQSIRGGTDSEVIFLFWLSQLRASTGCLDKLVDVGTITTTFQQTIKRLDGWFPAHHGKASKFNFVATNGRVFAATRWGHSLTWLEYRGGDIEGAAGRAFHGADSAHAVYIASEPTDGGRWNEVPDHSILVVDEELEVHTAGLT